MNVEIRHEGTDITASVISYQREQEICSGIATLRLIRVDNGREFLTWEQVDLYEEGSKKGEFYVKSVAVTHEGEMQIELQDASLKLQEYFVSEQTSFPYVTAARYWVERFFNEAGVDYQFLTTESGAPVAPDSPFGFNAAYDLIVQMLQISNWYFFINANGTAIIGSLTPSTSSPDASFNDDEIISIATNMNDKMLRNRAVVWGGADIINGTWVFADISVRTRWDYDANDKRTIVLSNSYIQTYYDAYRLANQMLNEFSTIYPEKTVVVVGEADVSIGDYVFIQSDHFHGGGVVTTVSSAVADSGFVTTLILDQRCPRLFGFYSHYDDYVYIGTYLDGVWRKMFSNTTWENYSTGITDLGITDLSINNGVFGSTTNSGLAFYRYITGGSWINFAPQEAYFPLSSGVDVAPSGFVTSGIYATCCTVDKMNNNIYYGFTTNSGVMNSGYLISGGVTAGSGLSWIVALSSNGSFLRSDQIVIERLDLSLITDLTIVDIDNNGVENVAICIARGSGIVLPEPSGVLFGQGYYDKLSSQDTSYNIINMVQDTNVYAIGGPVPEDDDPTNMNYVSLAEGNITKNSPVLIYGDEIVAYLNVGNDLIEKQMDELGSSMTTNTYEWTSGISAFYDGETWQHLLFKVDDSGTYHVGLYRIDGVNYYFKTIEATKSGDFSELDSSVITMATGATVDYYYKGPLFLITSERQFSDGGSRGWKIEVAGYNFVTGTACSPSETYISNNYPGLISGVWKLADLATFSLDSNDKVFGHVIKQYDIVTSYISDLLPITWNLEIHMFSLDSSSMSVGHDSTVVATVSDLIINKESLASGGGRASIIGFNMQKTTARARCTIGWRISGTWSYYVTDLDLPYFTPENLYEIASGDAVDGPNPNNLDFPVASALPYEFVDTRGVNVAYLINTNDPEVYTETLLDLPDSLFDPIYNWTFNSFAVNTDVNDGTIYGTVYRVSGSNYICRMCGWNRSGILTKYVNLGSTTSNPFSFVQACNKFFLLKYGSSNLLHFRWDEPSIPDPFLYTTTTNYVIKQEVDRSEFTLIYESPSILAVDISKNSPTVIYSPQEVSGLWQPMGFMGVSWTLSPYDFNTITSNFPIADARTFDIGTPSGMAVESGTVSLSGFRYIAFVNSGGMFYIDSTLFDPAIVTIATISGMATASGVSSGIANPSGLHRLETTNYSVSTPYFFAANPSGFWQRNPGMAYFTDYSAGLPSSAITIIRTDDRV